MLAQLVLLSSANWTARDSPPGDTRRLLKPARLLHIGRCGAMFYEVERGVYTRAGVGTARSIGNNPSCMGVE